MIRVLCVITAMFGLTAGLTFKWGSIFVRKNYPERAIWADGVVPFVIKDDFTVAQKDVIEEAMKTIENDTKIGGRQCIRFIKKSSKDSFFIQFLDTSDSDCFATGAGQITDKSHQNPVYLGPDCFVKGRIMHELMIKLGFIPEHFRPDRDSYIRINLTNVPENYKPLLRKLTEEEVITQIFVYDFGSILHYGPYQFASNETIPVITAIRKLPEGVTMGQREKLSTLDVRRIQKLYGCLMTETPFQCGFEDEDMCGIVQSGKDKFMLESRPWPGNGNNGNLNSALSRDDNQYLTIEAGEINTLKVAKISTPIIEKGTYCLSVHVRYQGNQKVTVTIRSKDGMKNVKRDLGIKNYAANDWLKFELKVEEGDIWFAEIAAKLLNLGMDGFVDFDELAINKGSNCSSVS